MCAIIIGKKVFPSRQFDRDGIVKSHIQI